MAFDENSNPDLITLLNAIDYQRQMALANIRLAICNCNLAAQEET